MLASKRMKDATLAGEATDCCIKYLAFCAFQCLNASKTESGALRFASSLFYVRGFYQEPYRN